MANFFPRWTNWLPLKIMICGIVIVTALATGLVVANWSGKDSDRKVADTASSGPASRVASSPAPEPSRASRSRTTSP